MLPPFLARLEEHERASAFALTPDGRRWLRAEVRARRIETAAWAALLIAATITGAMVLRVAMRQGACPALSRVSVTAAEGRT